MTAAGLGVLLLAGSTGTLPATFPDVAVFPTCTINATDRVVLECFGTTPYTPAYQCNSTEVTWLDKLVISDVYADSGWLTAIDSIAFSVDLGRLPVGEYRYEVRWRQCEDPTLVWTQAGSFNVTADPCPDIGTDRRRMYWADRASDTMKRAYLSGSKVENLAIPDLRDPWGVAFDLPGGHVYWTEPYSHRIRRASLDGSHVETLIVRSPREPQALALDLRSSQMFWTEDAGFNQALWRANFDGSSPQPVVPELHRAYGMAIDPVERIVYWIDLDGLYGRPTTIWRVDMSGAGRVRLFERLGYPHDLVVDPSRGYLFWIQAGEAGRSTLRRSRPDGSGAADILTGMSGDARGLAVDHVAGRLYWYTGYGSSSVYSATIDGEDLAEVARLGEQIGVLAVDGAEQIVYWASIGGPTSLEGQIGRAPFESDVPEPLVQRVGEASGLTLDRCAFAVHMGAGRFQEMHKCFLGPQRVVSPECDCSDLSRDGRVDLVDFAIQQRDFAVP